MLGDSGIAGSERSHVQLVQDCTVPGHVRARRPIGASERCANHGKGEVPERITSARNPERIVFVGQQSRRVCEFSADLTSRGVQQDLCTVEATSRVRIPAAVCSETVSFTGSNARNETVSNSERTAGQFYSPFAAVRIDQAHLDAVGLGRVDCKSSTSRQYSGTERKRRSKCIGASLPVV